MLMTSKVVVQHVKSVEEIINAMKFSVDKLDEIQKIKTSRYIVIKPNLCCGKSSSSGATTDVTIVESIIKLIININPTAEISIVESNNRSLKANEAFKIFGYNELKEKYPNVKLVNISEDRRHHVEIDGYVLANLMMPVTLLNMDYFISVTKLKTHIFEKISGVLKNQFGCLTKSYKAGFHPFMSKILTDLNLVYKPNLCIIDGIPAMEGFGPTDGTPIPTNLLIIGNDPVATDTVAAKIMGFNPQSVPHLKFAAKHGVGSMKDLEVVGEHVTPLNMKFVPRTAYWATRFALRIERYAQELQNIGRLVEKIRSASITVGMSYVREKVTYSFALKNIKTWILQKDG
jgi:uncharacterized protein (DUF362 family)